MSNSSNDWDNYLKKKEESNRILDQQVLRKSIEDKKIYKQDLDLQQMVKTKDKIIEKEQKKNELLNINLKNKLIQSEDYKKHAEKLEMQKFLAKQYEFQSNYLKNKQKLDKLYKIEEDKRKLMQIESQILKDAQLKKEEKQALLKQNLQVLKLKDYEKSQRELKLAQEKQAELELLNKRAEQDMVREKKYREFYKKIENHQDYLQNLYISHVSPQLSEKSKKVDIWINKSIAAQTRALQAKEAYEDHLRKETINNVKQTWKYQIDEKNEKLSKLKEEQQNIFNAIQSQINESKRIEIQRDLEKKDQNNAYKDYLINNSGSGRRNSSNSIENRISNINARSNSVVPNNILYPSSPKGSQISINSFNSSHNPITNPIGDSPPRPIQRPLYKPHTLIAI